MPCKGRPLDTALNIRLTVDAGFPLDLLVRTPAEVRQRLRWGDCFMHEITSKSKLLYETAHA